MANNAKSFRYINKLIGNFLKKACLIIGITFLLILGLEVTSRMILTIYYYCYPYDKPDKIEYSIKGYNHKDKSWVNDYFKEWFASNITEWKPYVYWRRKPFIGKYINIDKKGIRYTKQWNGILKDPYNGLNIFMFGGSTTWGTGVPDDYTIPSLVSKYLSEHGVNVNITNFGESGYVNTQEVIELFLQLQKNNIPEIVVFYDGGNDMFSAFQNRKAGIPMNEFNRKNEFNLTSDANSDKLLRLTIKKTFRRSATYRLYSICTKKFFNYSITPKEYFTNREDYHKTALDIINIYLSNIKLVNKLSGGSFISMFYWQPMIFNKNDLTEYERTQWTKCRGDIRDFYKAAYQMIKLKEPLFNGYHFYNISDIFIDNRRPIFIDHVHLNETGNEIIAHRITKDILKLIEEKDIFSREPAKGGP